MPTAHRLHDGAWAICADTHTCALPFHLPDTTPEQAEAIPLELLLPIFEIVDPPHHLITEGLQGKVWLDANGSAGRDYDLPARIFEDGTLIWCRNGLEHREHDKPAIIRPDGTRQWLRNSAYSRPAGGPARIDADGVGSYTSKFSQWRHRRQINRFLRRMYRFA